MRIRASDISRGRGAAKFTKTRKISRNSVKILSNTCLYDIFETYFSYWGCLLALPLVHFWSILLLKEQMMTSVRKTLKTLVCSARKQSISCEICLENKYKIGRFLPIAFW